MGDIESDGRRLLDSLPDRRVCLIGYSYGGLVAWWLSIHAPERIERLVILGSIFEKSHIPKRLRLLCLLPSWMMTWWRSSVVLSRLYAVCSDIPLVAPRVPAEWWLGEKDPYHSWRERKLPKWEDVDFVFHRAGAYPTEEEWARLQKFS